ncbi:MAG TPA: tRNA pseudouridine(38-40) synthase TruA [Acidobacteriaceae bacterium]|nr:tRNA pseudouridine(38-40) synthase TruA [Acidobacteriaceae bacterium]
MGTHSELPAAQNWKLTLAYDGTDFFGWQVQPDRVTIQGKLADAIERVTGERVLPQGSGRTDAGVHAQGQVASFALNAPIPAENLTRALNRTLPESIRVLRAEPAPSEFHARHSVIAKTYEYRIFRGQICPPWTARYAWALHWPLDPGRLQTAAQTILGTHDFTSFAASDPDLAAREAGHDPAPPGREGNVRSVFASEWSEEGDLLLYHVRGNGFLHHMVRNLVGTFVDVGRGHIEPAEVNRVLEARSRSAAGATAPARALFLVSVEY